MKFYSTNNKDHKVGLREAVVRGLAPDNGLYMPERIGALPKEFIESLHKQSFRDIAFTVARHLLGDEVPEQELRRITDQTIQFEAPLVEVEDNVYALELFHGPTLAFKDFGARFMSQLLGYFARQQDKEIVILVATSGDTGSAVANGFLGVKGTRVVVLYPSGKVSEVQEKQFTTLGENITALEVDGTFDDCQRLVKLAFQDEELRSEFFLTSANSINIARLIPQSFYYFQTFAQLKDRSRPVVFSVPSGNFGNVTGGLLAKRMGLPIQHFIVSTNINDVVPEYLRTRSFEPRPSKQTISNAMDVGNPSNFARMIDLYGHSYEALAKDVSGYAFTDAETREAMQQVYAKRKYVLDPHGAVGYLGLKKYLQEQKNGVGVFLETAHPGKFLEVVEQVLDKKITLPPALEKFLGGTKRTVPLTNSFEAFKSTLRRI
ncbi:threonine synthase [Fulvivirgaceae bacterium PWU4]|uniref:Threonine synthase n=1 Tax=Chryseosolibacter histidini TaxID=2782349 RepID=A0AAP2DG65_9BACT|nr:threonine synthase [Chryseosolibacter histidini]MBT1695750.1 threonine synthase [Chryseosolibacter histidini]